MSSPFARIVRIAVILMACTVLPVLVIASLAPHSPVAMKVTSGAVLLTARTVHFPGALAGRHASCSAGDAWRHAISSEENIIKQEINKTTRVLQKDGNLVQMETSLGLFWIPARDTLVLPEMLGEQGRDVYGTADHGVQRGDIVLDGGANAGVFTRHALNQGASKVVAIEPAPTALECLRRTFRTEIEAGRVVIYPKGVWNKDAELELTTSTELATTANSVALNRGAPGPKVLLTTIDALVRDLRLERVDFIKLDIEGAEKQALEGGRETIVRSKPRMAIALEHRREDPDEIAALVRRLWPTAARAFGPCVNVNGSVQPDVLFVY